MATETTTVGKFVVNKQLALCYAIGTSATVFLVGILLGFFERPRRLRMLDIARENEIFLIANGFRDTGGTNVTHYDGKGNALRFIEKSGDRLIFLVAGKRGKRAVIQLAPDGLMIAYAGFGKVRTGFPVISGHRWNAPLQ
ncbi:hypothetical protein E5S70_30370 [Ensifer adhaerens]|uniref:hypothetical protein n=1 Tax=Ensifer canadensis TaxID=555315 RepID=UPI0014906A78|nr:hypothetical protein [Ensifer canadensis]NOV20310.1 hypothetical protein [Ensifer canadensis]